MKSFKIEMNFTVSDEYYDAQIVTLKEDIASGKAQAKYGDVKMKITIDTKEKTVELIGEVNLEELLSTLKSLELNWKEFKIVPTNNTIYIPQYLQYPNQPFPWTIITTTI